MVSSPAVGSDGTIYIESEDYSVYALGSDGYLKWQRNVNVFPYSSPAIGTDGTIYVASWDGYFYALNPDST